MDGNTPIATVHLAAIQHNLAQAKQQKPNAKTIAVVKADAYGHGAPAVCLALTDADAFAVARVGEAIALREQGVRGLMVVLEGYINAEELALCTQHQLIPVVHSAYQLGFLNDEPIWLKINSGMSRLGFNYLALEQSIVQLRQKNIQTIVSHFANADVPQHPSNQVQLEEFKACRQLLNIDVPLSMANSSAVLGLDETGFDWIRPGIMLYGSSGTNRPDKRLHAAMTLTAPVVGINRLSAGDAIGYGSTWAAEQDCRVAVVGLGYADGYPREMPQGAPVVVNGKRRQLVGRISMDMCFVLLEDEDQVTPGDPIEFWGRQLPIDELAKFGSTIAYTLMSGLTQRVRKVYD